MSQTPNPLIARVRELEEANTHLLATIQTKDQTIANLSRIIQELTTAQVELCTQAQRLVIAKEKLMQELEAQHVQAQELHNKYKLLARQVLEM